MSTPPPPGSRRAARAAAARGQDGRSARTAASSGSGRRARGPVSRRTGTPLTRRQLRWRRARRTLYSLVALGIIGPVVAFMVAYVAVDVPQPSDLDTNQVATVFYDDGTTALSKIVPPDGNRTNVTIDQIPVQLREAVLAAEDRTFYSNPGFSIPGIARAVLNNVTGGDTQGGSTITQQYVKNALTGDDRTLTRKLKELVISSKMSRQTSKDDILTAYLNTIYFGRGAYGVAAASQAYFGTSVSTLTVPQAAVLASSIRSPSAYDPESHPQAAKDRWGFVLDGMVTEGWITPTARAALTYPAVQPKTAATSGTSATGPEGLILDQVTAELEANGVSEQDLNTEGLQITTTISKQNQDAAQAAVSATLTDQPTNLRPAVVSIDPKTGGVRAYYGNSDGSGTDFASTWAIQPGSSFKVFSLAAALKAGVPITKQFDGSSPQTIDGTTISNSDGESCPGRTCDLAEALKLSLNTVYYQLTSDIGAQKVVDTAHAAGIPTTDAGTGKPSLLDPESGQPTDGITLGQYGVPPLSMASAYGTLADNGVQHDPYFVQKVTTSDGRVLLDRGTGGATAGKQAIDTAVAQNVIAAMEPIAASSRGHELANGRQSASKTGTAQLGDTGKNANGWMIGCTPSLCTASVVTTNDGSAAQTAAGRLVYGSGLPSDVWTETMNAALSGTPGETFPDAPPLNGSTVAATGGSGNGGGGNGGANGSGNGGGQASTTQAPVATTDAPATSTQAPVATTTAAPVVTTTPPAPPVQTNPTVVTPTTTAGGRPGAPGGAPVVPGG